jgi:DNA-binding MarR family transcriptional regulator
LLAQVGAQAAAQFAERLSTLDLAPQHAGILRVIHFSSGISQRELGQVLGVLPSRMVVLVDELEKRGLVQRHDDQSDRRSYALHLSDKGQQVLRDIRRIARDHDDAVCEPLDASEREQLTRLLTRLAGHQGLTPGVHPGFRKL